MKYIRFSVFFLIGVSGLFLYQSCSMCSRQQTVENIVIDVDLSDFDVESIYFNMGNQVIYALPTPIEASMLVKNWGIPYPELLSNPANASKYLTKNKMAVNFGVYITDIVCAGLYEQAQTVLQYKQAMQQLVEGLGLQSAVDRQTIDKLEANINNKSELMQIISDIYASCSEFLSEDDRDFYALAVLSGGWVEGMYIATSNVTDVDLMKQIVTDNKLTFDLLWLALGQMDVIPEEATYLMLDMSYVAHLFGHQTLLSVPPTTEILDMDNITPKFFAELKNHIQLLRQQFTKI